MFLSFFAASSIPIAVILCIIDFFVPLRGSSAIIILYIMTTMVAMILQQATKNNS